MTNTKPSPIIDHPPSIIPRPLFRIFFASCLIAVSAIGHSQNLDINLLHSINSGNSAGWNRTNRIFSQSMAPVCIGAPSSLFLYGTFAPDSATKRNSLVAGTSLLASGIVAVGMKYAFNRKRPYVTYPDLISNLTKENTPSFPSGHASSAFATATSLSLMYPRWYVIAPSFLWAGAVGYSRMELGAHYASDVLAGAIMGAGSSFLMWKLNKSIAIKKKI